MRGGIASPRLTCAMRRGGQACRERHGRRRKDTAWWRPIPSPLAVTMTEPKTNVRARLAPAGLMFLAITSVGWGFNWPVTKFLLGELPPLTLRGSTGVIGAALLAALALIRGQSLAVERAMWPRLLLAATAECHRLDGADGAGAVVAAGGRGGADRLHHAGVGLAAGLADPRRAADLGAHDCAGDGARRACRASWAATVSAPARRNCRVS